MLALTLPALPLTSPALPALPPQQPPPLMALPLPVQNHFVASSVTVSVSAHPIASAPLPWVVLLEPRCVPRRVCSHGCVLPARSAQVKNPSMSESLSLACAAALLGHYLDGVVILNSHEQAVPRAELWSARFSGKASPATQQPGRPVSTVCQAESRLASTAKHAVKQAVVTVKPAMKRLEKLGI